ncbi:MAG: MarR family winged helix-turn-helix transcriptional regulator [Miltoncostaeaceae bacterium]
MNRATTPGDASRENRALRAASALASAAEAAARDRERHAGEFGVTDAKLAMLDVLRCCSDGGACLYTLGDELGVSRPNVTKLVDGLERSGLAERRRHPDDGRMVRAELTPGGRDLADEALPGRADRMAGFWDDLSDDELDVLTGLLERVATACAQRAADPA